MSSLTTEEVVNSLYAAFLAGDLEGMLATFSEDIAFRFLGQVEAKGKVEARRFFAHSAGLLLDLDFRIKRIVFDGDYAAATWHETALTADGVPWENHGVDVFEVGDGKIVSLHENNDVRLVHQHFARYVSPAAGQN